MRIYVVLIHDRHFDIEAQVFSAKDGAIAWARKQVAELDRFGDAEEERVADWTFYCRYGDGCNVRVYEREMDGAR